MRLLAHPAQAVAPNTGLESAGPNLDSAKFGLGQVGLGQVGLGQVGLGQVGLGQVGLGDVALGQARR